MQNVGGFLGKSLIIPLNVAVSEGLPPFGSFGQQLLDLEHNSVILDKDQIILLTEFKPGSYPYIYLS